jgi:hypothetical protein
MLKRMILILTVISLCLPVYVMADGISFLDIRSANMEVQATTQRAVVWLRNGVWEIHIMPIFKRHKAKAAWVVPLPVLPQVKESSSDFFNHLELLSAPMFMEVCSETTGGGCGTTGSSSSSSSGGASIRTGTGHVEIWEHGTVGDLDYVIITTDHQVYMVEWLRNNNYYVTDLAEASLKKFEANSTFFFAAKISENADPAKPIKPVRFVLPDLKEPMYPLMLTGLGVPDGASLELTVWLISPNSDRYVPTSHGFDKLEENQRLKNIDEYTSAVRRFYSTHASGTFLFLFAENTSLNDRYHLRGCIGGVGCVPFSEMGIKAPETWCNEVKEMYTNGDYLSRYQGRLGPVDLSKDLKFGQLPRDQWGYHNASNIYIHNTCEEEPDPGPCGRN